MLFPAQKTLQSFCINWSRPKPVHSKTDFTQWSCSCLPAASAAAEHMETKIMDTVLPPGKKKKKREKQLKLSFWTHDSLLKYALKYKLNLAIKSVDLITGHSTVPQEAKALKNNSCYHTSDLQNKQTHNQVKYFNLCCAENVSYYQPCKHVLAELQHSR